MENLCCMAVHEKKLLPLTKASFTVYLYIQFKRQCRFKRIPSSGLSVKWCYECVNALFDLELCGTQPQKPKGMHSLFNPHTCFYLVFQVGII